MQQPVDSSHMGITSRACGQIQTTLITRRSGPAKSQLTTFLDSADFGSAYWLTQSLDRIVRAISVSSHPSPVSAAWHASTVCRNQCIQCRGRVGFGSHHSFSIALLPNQVGAAHFPRYMQEIFSPFVASFVQVVYRKQSHLDCGRINEKHTN